MARRHGLTGPLAVSAGLVLLAHGVALDWLARHAPDTPVLRPLATPIFTRMLAQQAPPPPPPPLPKTAAARTTPARPAITSVAKTPSMPEVTATQVASAEPQVEPPQPTPPEPEPAPATTAPAAAPPQPTVTAEATTTVGPTTPDPTLDTWPRDTRLNYKLGGQYRGGPISGSARVQWQREGNLYQARIEFDILWAGGRTMTSQGEVTADGLVPRAYEETRNGRSRGVRLREGDVVFADGKTEPRPGGVQDTASQFVELSHRFATGREKLEVGRTVDIWLARPGQMNLWTYEIVELEKLQTPRLGIIEAYRLKPRPIANPQGNITAEIWFAPTLQYLPVRIRVTLADDAFADLMVDNIEQR